MNPFKYNPDVEQNRATLTFKDAALERLFFNQYTEQYLVHGRICHILAVVFYSAFGLFDTTLFPDSSHKMWFIRYGIIFPIFVMGFLYSFSSSYKQYWQYLFLGYVLVTGGGYVFMVGITPFSNSYFLFTGIIFCLFFGYAFIRLRVIFSSVAGLLLTLGYIGVVIWRNNPPVDFFLNNLPHILGINFLGMCIGYLQFRGHLT
jgi:hypothetical protein